MKIISGGQTGVDIGSIFAAHDCGLNTGGYAAQGYKNENGYRDKGLLQELGLIDNKLTYMQRTIRNIVLSDATLIIAKDTQSPGTKLTLNTVTYYEKPHFIFHMTYKQNRYNLQKYALIDWLLLGAYGIINVGGNRESVAPGIQRYTYYMMMKVLNAHEDALWECFVANGNVLQQIKDKGKYFDQKSI